MVKYPTLVRLSIAAIVALCVSTVRAQKMYWVDPGAGKIQRANLDGTGVEDLVTAGLTAPNDIALDPVGGKMYWTDLGTQKIQRADLDGSAIEDLLTSGDGLALPQGIALDVAGGKMYWTDLFFIRRANLDGSAIEDLFVGSPLPMGIALDVAGGKMYWTDLGALKIQRADLDGSNVQDLITTGLSEPGSIALDVSAGKMYWRDSTLNKIQRANLDGTNIQDVVGPSLNGPFGLALDRAGGKIYWAEASPAIDRANLDGSDVETLVDFNFLANPRGMALDLLAACCNFIGDTCAVADRQICVDGGGAWLEGIPDCTGSPCATGACCTAPLPIACDDDGGLMDEATCDSLVGNYVGGSSCVATPLACPVCPFEDEGHCKMPTGPSIIVSDRSRGIRVADDFQAGTDGTIDRVCWWPAFFNQGLGEECAEMPPPDAFRVRFYLNDGGLPGTEIGPAGGQTLVPDSKQWFGGSSRVWRYTAPLSSPVPVTEGTCYWIEITGDGEGLNGCNVYWATSAKGNGYMLQDENFSFGKEDIKEFDAAFCLDIGLNQANDCGGIPGKCCECGVGCSNVTHDVCNDAAGDFTPGDTCPGIEPCPSVPPNDACAAANGVTDGTTLVSNLCATDDGFTNSCPSSGPEFKTDVWYDYIATCTGVATFSHCSSFDFDAMMAVYEPTLACDEVCPVANDDDLLQCDDDGCDFLGAAVGSIVFAPVEFGKCYKVRVGGWSGATGTLELDITCDKSTIYVDDTAGGADNGSSWVNAFVNLQDGLDQAVSLGTPAEIWVATGTYHPDDGASVDVDDRNETFQLVNDIEIYGGFDGLETEREERNPALNLTTLTGDLLDNDIGFTNNGDNSFHVVTGSGTNATSILDGFTISGGNSLPGDAGGGMLNISGSPTITNCKFIENSANSAGGGMSNQAGSAPTLTDCTFEGNSAGSAGAMDNTGAGSDPTLTNCVFLNNAAVGAGGGAGAMNNTNADPILTNCTFIGNTALGAANGPGAVFNRSAANPLFVNCTFRSNEANAFGGVTDNFGAATPTFIGCVFRDNVAGADGGAIVLSELNTTVTTINCTFSGNTAAGFGGGIFHNRLASNSLTVTNCILFGNSDSGGTDESAQISTIGGAGTTAVDYSLIQGLTGGLGGVGNIGGNPLFSDADLRIPADSPAVDAADNSVVPTDATDADGDGDTGEILPIDLDGNRRFVDELLTVDTGMGTPPIVDMGAFEAFRDCDSNGTPDDLELEPGGGGIDCNSNDNLDKCDIVECEGDLACGDCNNNGVPDSCDIAGGASGDCDSNNIPDECDIKNCPSNFELSPEDCDDCNNNEVLDVCDITAGTSEDLLPDGQPPGDGIPDECKAWDGGVRLLRGQNENLRGTNNWGTAVNWENDTLPGITNSVIIDAAIVDLDISSSVASVRLLSGTTLNAAGVGAEDLTIGTGGIFVQGDFAGVVRSSLKISNDRFVDVSAGPITIGAAGEIVSNLDTDSATNSLIAASIDIRNGSCECPPADGGSLFLDGTSMATTGNLVLVPTIGAVCSVTCAAGRGGTTPPILEMTASIVLIGGDTTMNAREGGAARGGTTPPILRMTASEFETTGNFTMNDSVDAPVARGGTTPPILSITTSTFDVTGNFTMNGRGDAPAARGGTTPPILTAVDSFMTIDGDFTVNGPASSPTARGGTTPPILNFSNTVLTIAGDFILNGDVEINGLTASRAGPMPSSFRLSGNFVNHSVSPANFELSTNSVTFEGEIPQTMEAGGEDRGAGTMNLESNFFIGTLEIAENADVTLLDTFDNDGQGQTVAEAQYVDLLVIQSGAVFTVDGSVLYYNELENNGTVVLAGSGAMIGLAPSFAEACCLSKGGCTALPAVDCFLAGGTTGGESCGGDADGDGVPDGCDVCLGNDATGDSDGDGICDDSDVCPGFDDTVDSDGDGVADGCDICPGSNDNVDSDGDGVPDGCDVCPGFDDTIDSNGNGIPDGCEIESPVLAQPPHDILKNRYISIDPRGSNQLNVGADMDIRLTLTSTLVNGVTAVGSQWWANAPDADCISVVGPTRPVPPPNWDACPTVHLTGCPIIPTSTYAIVAVDGGIVTDPPLTLATQAKPGVKWHGDCVGFFTGTEWTAPNATTNADDFLAAIKTFQDPNAGNATHTSVTDMVPNLDGTQINLIVNINDVFSIIKGFQGFEYPGADLTQCP